MPLDFASEALSLDVLAPVDGGPRDDLYLEIIARSGFEKLDGILNVVRRQFLTPAELDNDPVDFDLANAKFAELNTLLKFSPTYVERLQSAVAALERACSSAVKRM